MNYANLLETRGFSLNEYPEGNFWEFIVTDNENLKISLCEIFNAKIELFDDGTDIDTLILQCNDGFTECQFYYDCNSFYMSTDEFMQCVEQMEPLHK